MPKGFHIFKTSFYKQNLQKKHYLVFWNELNTFNIILNCTLTIKSIMKKNSTKNADKPNKSKSILRLLGIKLQNNNVTCFILLNSITTHYCCLPKNFNKIQIATEKCHPKSNRHYNLVLIDSLTFLHIYVLGKWNALHSCLPIWLYNWTNQCLSKIGNHKLRLHRQTDCKSDPDRLLWNF